MKDKQSCLYPKGRQPTKNNHHQRAADGKVFVSATSVDDQCHHRRDMMKKIFHSYHQIAYDALPTGNIAELDTNDEKWDLSSWTLILSDNCMDHLICRNNISIIKDLDLSGADGITDVGLIKLANKIPQLMSLSLEQASQITEIGLSHLVQRCCKLQILNLSQCCGISGNGFAVLGQYASGLLKLSLSGCGQITSYSLLAIFQGCKMLTDLDLSLSAVTDKEISVLGTSCRDIKVLNLKGCVRVSDYGVLGLSKGLCNLTNFTISRNDMVTSITDVSLLAISEDCQCLKIIDLSGCQMLTDISLCWLAKGCKYLQQLNLTNCSKVTNAGIQYLGEECKELQKVKIKNLNKVSDIGLHYIANGCPYLEYLNVSGLYLLTDGEENQKFGLGGVKSLANSHCNLKLRHLNMHGCFQVRSLASISLMRNLESLVLSGCNSLTFSGLAMVAKECRAISHLSFAGCGKCINEEIIETLCLSLRKLKIFDLSDCIKVGERSLKSITLCHKLSSLNLSGCKKLSNYAILALGGAKYLPSLEALILNHCPKIDDTALTWIAHCFRDHWTLSKHDIVTTLTTLLVKDTKVTVKALKALKPCFPYSSLEVVGSTCVGFLPLSRVKDRKIINQHAKMEHCAAMIQGLVRGQKCRLLFWEMKKDKYLNTMAGKIQRVYRGSSARCRIKELQRRKQQDTLIVAIKRIQIFLRSAINKRHVKAIEASSAVQLQALFRGYLGRKLVSKIKYKNLKVIEHREACCVRIQAICRMYFSKLVMMRKRYCYEAEVLREQELYQQRACIKIQSAWRTAMVRHHTYKLRIELSERRMKQREEAVGLIARKLRLSLLRMYIMRRITKARNIAKAVEKIQGWYRRIIAEQKKVEVHQAMLQNDRIVAATLIQSAARRQFAKSLRNHLKNEHDQLERLRVAKATVIACWFRVILAKLQLQQIRSIQQTRTEISAAICISAIWRGFLGRKCARLKLESKKRLWKQIWNEEYQAHFYYNELTGESRWSKPQQLSDFNPTTTSTRLICSNCNYYDAKVECGSCEEYFCEICWDAVHYGGKRRHHEYRSLYENHGRHRVLPG